MSKKYFFKQNTLFALIMGASFVIASFITYKSTGYIFNNNVLNKIIMFLYIIGLFMQIRMFRESSRMEGYISYGQILLTGLWISFVCSFIYSVYVDILYSRDPDLLRNVIELMGMQVVEMLGESQLTDTFLETYESISPGVMAFTEFFAKLFNGIIYTLIIGLFLKKKRPIFS